MEIDKTALEYRRNELDQDQSKLELLEEQFAALQDEIREMDQTARRALKSLDAGSKGAITFDVFRYRQHREKLQRQLPVLEIKVRRERVAVLKARRAASQQQLEENLQPELNAAKARFHEAEEILQRAWKAHALLEAKAYQIEEGLKIDYEDMRSNQRALQSLITEITGVVDEELDQTENLLIRN